MKLKKITALLLAIAMIFSLAACGKSRDDTKDKDDNSSSASSVSENDDGEYPVTIGDVTIQSHPTRIVSLSPSLTEKLYDIGLEEYLVGVSDYCNYPIAAQNLPQCGTNLLPNIAAIKDLEPHVIITQSQMVEEDLEDFQKAGIDVVLIRPAKNIEQFKESYVSLAILLEGNLLGADIGNSFAVNLQSRLDYLSGYLVPYAQSNGMKKALFLRLLDFNVATGDTLENELLVTIGMRNIAEDYTGWLYPEDIAKADGRADFEAIDIIFMDEDFVDIKMLEQSSYYRGLQATIKDRYMYIDSIVFERQGLRMLDAFERMAAYAYPDAVPPLPSNDDEPEDEDSSEAA